MVFRTFAFLLATLALCARADAAMEQTTLAYPSVTIAFLAEYVAEDAHFFEKRGLEVKTRLIAGTGATNSVIAGAEDFAFGTGASLSRAVAHGQKLITIATLGGTLGEILVLRKDLAEAGGFDANAPLSMRGRLLAGRRFGIGGVATISDAYVKVVAQEAGISPDSVIVAPMQAPDMLAAMSRKALDGFALGPPWPEMAVANGLAVVVADGGREPSRYVPFAAGVLVTRSDFCPAHRSICEKIGGGLVDAINFIDGHRDETIALLQKRFPTLPQPVLAASFDAVRAGLPRPPLTTAKALANSDRLNVDVGFLKSSEMLTSYDPLFDNEFVAATKSSR